MKEAWAIVKETIREMAVNRILRLSAATAYYAMFSIGPTLVLVGALAALVFGRPAVQQKVESQLQLFVGSNAAHVIQSMMSAQWKTGSVSAVVFGTVVLVVGATAVFIQLQDSLNVIWGVEAKPGHSIKLFIRDRLLSLAMVVGVGFMLLLSISFSALLSALSRDVGQSIALPRWLTPAFDAFVSFVVIALLFALIFKVLPDVIIRWRDVWVGAFGTSALFSGGKYVLGLYLSHETDISAYGAGTAFIAVMAYVYYASLILYLGAEFTRVYARHRGYKLRLSRYAVRVDRGGLITELPDGVSADNSTNGDSAPQNGSARKQKENVKP